MLIPSWQGRKCESLRTEEAFGHCEVLSFFCQREANESEGRSASALVEEGEKTTRKDESRFISDDVSRSHHGTKL